MKVKNVTITLTPREAYLFHLLVGGIRGPIQRTSATVAPMGVYEWELIVGCMTGDEANDMRRLCNQLYDKLQHPAEEEGA